MKISKSILSEIVDQIYNNICSVLEDNDIDITKGYNSYEEFEIIEQLIKESIQLGIEENLL